MKDIPVIETPIYLDNHATTPCDPAVVEAMMPYLTTAFGNAASRHHSFGWAANEGVELAREQVAELIGASPKEIVFVGNPNAQTTKDLVAEMYRGYLPNRVCLGVKDSGHEVSGLPLLEGRRRIDDKPTAYVCENYVCKLPVTTPSSLTQQLRP